MAIKFGSLFTGIGGFDLAFESAGMECAWQAEIDKNCLKLLEHRFLNARRYTDVRNITRDTAEPVDLICGGFPCQDLSVAGKRKGLAGERSGLWFEFHRVIEEFQPRWVVIENVPGLLSSCGCVECRAIRRILRVHAYLRRKRKIHFKCAICNAGERLLESHKGRDLAVILRGLEELGYGWAYRVLDAQYFGVAQRRRRVFIVGCLVARERPLGKKDFQVNKSLLGLATEVLFEPESGERDTPPSREAGEGTARVASFSAGNSGESYGIGYTEEGTPPLRAGASGTNMTPTIVGTVNPWDHETKRIHSENGLAPTLAGSDGKGGQRMPYVFQQNTRDEVRLMNGDGKIAGAISAEPGAKQQNYIAFSSKDGGQDAGEIAPTLRSMEYDKSHANGGGQIAVAYNIQHNDGGEHKRKDRPNGGLYVNETDTALTVGSTDMTAVTFRMEAFGKYSDDGTASTVKQRDYKDATDLVAWEMSHADEAVRENGEIAPTLQQRMGTGGNQVPMVGVRRLTPTECERLQGFPDSWTAGFADSTRYRMLGNAVAVPVVEWIGKRIVYYHNIKPVIIHP